MNTEGSNIVERSKIIMLEIGASPILYLTLGLSVVSLGIMLERAWFFSRHSSDAARLAGLLEEKLGAGDTIGAESAMRAAGSVEGDIVAAGLSQSARGGHAAHRAMQSAMVIARLRLERGLAFLGTLGNNAPFVGLLGTVIGIVQAFHELERAGLDGSASNTIMGAISEALVATAIGLAVAIPAVAAYNYFQRRIRTVLGNAEALQHIVLLHTQGGNSQGAPSSTHNANPTAAEPTPSKPVRLSLAALSTSNGER